MKTNRSSYVSLLLVFLLNSLVLLADRNRTPVLEVRSESQSKGANRTDRKRTFSWGSTISSNATVGSLRSNRAEAFARRQPGSVRIGAEADGSASLRPPASEDFTTASSVGTFNARARVVAPSALGNISFPLRLQLNGTLQVKTPAPGFPQPGGREEVVAKMFTSLTLNNIVSPAGTGDGSLDAVAGLGISTQNPEFRAAFGNVATTSETIEGIPMVVKTVQVNGTVTIPLAVNVSQRGVDAFGNSVFSSDSVPLSFQAGVSVNYHNFRSDAKSDFRRTGEIAAGPGGPAGAVLIIEEEATAFFPQAAAGGNFAESTLLATNNHDTVAQVRLRSFQSNGLPLSLNFASGESGSDITFSVPARSTVALTAVRTQPAQATAGWVRIDSNLELTTDLIFSFFSGTSLVAEAGVLDSTPLNEFHLPIDTRGSANTGIAFANPLSVTVRITVTLYDGAGSRVAERTFDLAPGTHLARFVNEDPLFSGVPGMDEFLGSASVKVEGENAIPAVAIRQQNVLLTVIPVSEGPIAP